MKRQASIQNVCSKKQSVHKSVNEYPGVDYVAKGETANQPDSDRTKIRCSRRIASSDVASTIIVQYPGFEKRHEGPGRAVTEESKCR
ncbi:hypothetical protein WA026_010483 [Henosepilachna vigintioctopunctata]|uniref:Uncharacterized protein n=1 Tax=Henosepilachna vigintioctopunctata TaxID=420089 RepID=A0AAW1VE58_9CUCU